MSDLSNYTELSAFNETTVLVRQGKKVFVKKKISKDTKETYEKLKGRQHKNVSEIKEVFEFEDSCVVIEEYVQGESLKEILLKKKTLGERETKKIIADICDGLLFLHGLNIIHRDINPNNIIITNDNTAKIIDFDICRSVKKNASCDTAVLGTVGYAAPEQFGFSQSDVRTDIYAAGVLANVMLTDELPNRRIYEKKLGRVIKKAVSTDPENRYKSIKDFKHSFTNETDENTNIIVRALRCVPGFRTKTAWKMGLAAAMYFTYIPVIIMFLIWSAADGKTFFAALFGILLTFAVPYILLTNLKEIRKIISKNKKTALAVSAVISVLSFFGGAAVMAQILDKIL